MDTTQIWTAVALGVVAVVGAIALVLKNIIVEWGNKAVAAIRRGSLASGIRRLRLFHEAVDRVQHLPFVDRVLVFRGRDSGGLPDPKRPFYIECLTGRTNEGVEQAERYTFELKIDTHFCRLLEEMVGEESVAMTTANLPDGQLKALHMADGIAHTVKYFLTVDRNELLFLAVANFSREFTPAERADVDLAVARVRAAIRS